MLISWPLNAPVVPFLVIITHGCLGCRCDTAEQTKWN
jgi:hypothetical protein